MFLRFLCLIVCIGMCGAAQAAVIYNFGDNAHSVDVWEEGEFIPRLIPADGKLEIPGQVKIRFAGIEKTLESSVEYAIWSNGVFVVQMRRK